MSFFMRLIETTDEERRAFEAIPKVYSMINRGLTRDEYGALLHDLYHVVWHFCPTMAAAASRLPDEFVQVRYHLYEGIEEEKGHETWVLEDVVATGGDVEMVRTVAPSPPIQAMIAFNYYTSERVHPCGVLGMLYALEVISSVYAGQVTSSIARSTGYPDPGAFKFLSSHASMDLDHMAKLKTLVKTIEDPAAQEAIVNATRTNFWLFGQLYCQPAFQAKEMAAS